MTQAKHKQLLFFFLLLLSTALLRLPTVIEPYWHGDEGVTLTVGTALRHGAMLYRDIHDNKPPLLYFIAWLSPNLFVFKLWTSAAFTIMITLLFALLKRFYSLKTAFFTSLFIAFLGSIHPLEGPVVNGEIWQLLPVVAGLLVFTRSVITPQQVITGTKKSKKDIKSSLISPNWTYLLTGFFLGIGFLFKQPVIYDLAAIVLFIIYINIWPIERNKVVNLAQTLIILCIGFTIPFLLALTYFAILLNAHNFLQNAYIDNIRYAQLYNAYIIPQGKFILRTIGMGMITLVMWLSIRKHSRLLQFSFLLFCLEILGVFTTGRNYTHYLIGIFPSLALIFAALFSQGIKKMVIPATPVIACLVYTMFFFHVVTDIGFTLGKLTGYYTNTIAYALQKESFNDYVSFFDPITIDRYQLIEHIKAQIHHPGDLFIYSDDPLPYPMTNSYPLSGYIAAYHISFYNSYNTVLRQLIQSPPKIIVVSQPVKFPFPDLMAFIKTNYTETYRNNSYIVYSLNQ